MPLYKYLASERIDVLLNREIRFTQAAALNDPFELNAYYEVLIQDAELVQHIVDNPLDLTPHLLEAYEKLTPEIKAQMPFELMLQFAKATMASDNGERIFWETIGVALGAMRDVTPQVRDQMTQTFRTRIGILSLSEIADSTLMWAHYAAQHRGFTIGFDETSAFFNRSRGPEDEFFHLRRVEYKPVTAFADLRAMDGQRILITKAPEWSYEREWRMLIPVEMATRTIGTPDELIHLCEFPPSAVLNVVLGARIPDVVRRALTDVLSRDEYSHVGIHSARFDDRTGTVIVERAS